MTYPKFLQSSVDPSSLSLTIKGLLTALVPLIIYIGKQYDIDITDTDMVYAIQQITTFISIVAVAIGLLRKGAKKLGYI